MSIQPCLARTFMSFHPNLFFLKCIQLLIQLSCFQFLFSLLNVPVTYNRGNKSVSTSQFVCFYRHQYCGLLQKVCMCGLDRKQVVYTVGRGHTFVKSHSLAALLTLTPPICHPVGQLALRASQLKLMCLLGTVFAIMRRSLLNNSEASQLAWETEKHCCVHFERSLEL